MYPARLEIFLRVHYTSVHVGDSSIIRLSRRGMHFIVGSPPDSPGGGRRETLQGRVCVSFG